MADAATYPKPSKHVGSTFIPSAGFEPAIPAIKRDRLKYVSLQIISFVTLDVAALVLHIQVFFLRGLRRREYAEATALSFAIF